LGVGQEIVRPFLNLDFEQGADVFEQETGLTQCGWVVNLDKLAKWLLVVER
jgi:hypothetical protein